MWVAMQVLLKVVLPIQDLWSCSPSYCPPQTSPFLVLFDRPESQRASQVWVESFLLLKGDARTGNRLAHHAKTEETAWRDQPAAFSDDTKCFAMWRPREEDRQKINTRTANSQICTRSTHHVSDVGLLLEIDQRLVGRCSARSSSSSTERSWNDEKSESKKPTFSCARTRTWFPCLFLSCCTVTLEARWWWWWCVGGVGWGGVGCDV